MAWKFNGPIDHANPKLHDYKVHSTTLSSKVNLPHGVRHFQQKSTFDEWVVRCIAPSLAIRPID
jgi:hypothetical protein